jgi:uncharacterized protein YajQ (UPF0234 family)
MASFSFDIVSEYDKAEMNNVFALAQKEIGNRYDFKGTPAAIEWIGDKTGLKLIGSNEWQLDSITDIVRKKLSMRNQSSKVLDLSKPVATSNLKATKEVPFIAGLDQEKTKKITKLIPENHPTANPIIQGDAVRVSSGSKEELQAIMKLVQSQDYDFPLLFTNYR